MHDNQSNRSWLPAVFLLSMMIFTSLTATGENTEENPDGWLEQTVFLLGATPEVVHLTLPDVKLSHPFFGDFTLSIEPDDNPVVVSIGYMDSSGQETYETPSSYIATVNEFDATGRLAYSSRHFSALLFNASSDLELSGRWESTGLSLTIGAQNPEYVGNNEPAEQSSSGAGNETGLTNEPSGHDRFSDHNTDCENLVEANELPADTDCAALEESEPDTLVGDDSETGAQTSLPVNEVRVKVYHEDKTNRAQQNCEHAQKRIFSEETLYNLVCDLFDHGFSHDQGTDKGQDDWDFWLVHYFNGEHGHKSGTESWNGGRFVFLMVDETKIDDTPEGYTVLGRAKICSSDWTIATADDPCGHGVVSTETNSYYVHSAGYAEGQTFVHELLHTIGVDFAAENNDPSDTHDHRSVSKNYNGKEGCSGWGDDFISNNVFFWTASGSACHHTHYWLSSESEKQVNNKMDDHVEKYP